MSSYLSGVLGLFDGTVRAMLGVPIFAFFLAGLLLLLGLGLFLFLKRAVSGGKG